MVITPYAPEPWTSKPTGEIFDAVGHRLAGTGSLPLTREGNEYLRHRIVAAVNACAGLSTEALEGIGQRGILTAIEKGDLFAQMLGGAA